MRRPIYETLAGWNEPLAGELPRAARAYVELVERELEVEVSLVGTGAEREAVLSRYTSPRTNHARAVSVNLSRGSPSRRAIASRSAA